MPTNKPKRLPSRLPVVAVVDATSAPAARQAQPDNLSGAHPLPTRRSRVTNGNATFLDGDEQSLWARRFKDKIGIITSDMGGADCLSEAQRSLVRVAATLSVQLETMESALASGADVDIGKYATVANSLRRIVESIGLCRVARDMTPTLADIAASIRRREAAQAE